MPQESKRGDAPSAETFPRPHEGEATPAGPAAGSTGERLALSPGQVLAERYWIQRLLGRGGMGEVWHALDLKLRVDVALKSLHPKFYADERRRELLRQEVRAAREVISPNVCRVFDLVEVDGRELLSMEHIDGETLLSLLERHAPLPLTEARDLALQFLAGLEAVHEAGLVHRDFKPENVMITRSGRVVVMDFGIAQRTRAPDGSVAGTPAYMAPEQSRGEEVDARTDLYAVGVVLAEMVSEVGVRDHTSRKSVWEGIHADPPRIPQSPWTPVIRKAVAADPAERPDSAQSLVRSLQEITLRVEGAEEKHPYPGLASFTEEDAEHFFGREAEVESMWRKLRRAHLLALVGPSGAGKSSFLRAGLIPALPEGWAHLYCHPGEQPFASLVHALAGGRLDEAEAPPASPEDPGALVAAARRWREGHSNGLVVVDQFEELFTLNAPDVQSRFAGLLGRLVSDADVRVLVSMRDDFLFRCHDHPALAPIASELTLIGPPTGAALSRALVQPALSLGYRFEDESLVREMLEEVARERGALPLLAFAAAGLWERRDPDDGLLTREAYEAIGGVAGALARHAEATLERIGREREPVVRELFRNLVTAQGTRAVRDRDELLSVFDDTSSAEAVLGELTAARLLTSFDVSARGSADTTQRVEVIHESLLSAWPRLVRWRMQDAEGAQLRDQLRQAARLWDERGRPDELLWTGASYLEYRAWRERYPGGLSDLEGAFAAAMAALAGRRRRRRRWAVASLVVLLAAGLVTFGGLWRRSETAREQAEAARQDAVAEARRAEASKLLALGRLELDEDPTAAVAYALKSLERTDSTEARRFALEALWRGPVRTVVREGVATGVAFSPDGRWLATTGENQAATPLELWPSDGGEPRRLGGHWARPRVGDGVVFSPDSRLFISRLEDDRVALVRSVPDGRTTLRIELERPSPAGFSADGQSVLTRALTRMDTEKPAHHVQSWPLDGAPPRSLGRFEGRGHSVDPTGQWLAYALGSDVFMLPVEGLGTTPPRRVWRHERFVLGVVLAPRGRAVAFLDLEQTGRLVALDGSGARGLGLWPGTGEAAGFSRDGSLLAASATDGTYRVVDLEGPAEADSTVLRLREPGGLNMVGFHPSGRWLATAEGSGASLWPLGGRHPYVLGGVDAAVTRIAFAPDGRSLVAAYSDGRVRILPLTADSTRPPGVLIPSAPSGQSAIDVDVDPSGQWVLAALGMGDFDGGQVVRVPAAGGRLRRLAGFPRDFAVVSVAFSHDGRLAAASGGASSRGEGVIRVWDLESGEVRVLETEDGSVDWELEFTRRGELVAAGPRGVRVWNLEDGTSRLLQAGSCEMAIGRDDRYVFVWCDEPWTGGRHDLETGRSEPLDLTSHPRAIRGLDVDPEGRTVVTAGPDGVVRVGPVTGEEPHLLIGHEDGPVRGIAVSPDGRWIASAGSDGTVRLWPMPEGQPLHTLPHDDLLETLRGLTNVRVVEDKDSPTGYVLGHDPFPGWEKVPRW